MTNDLEAKYGFAAQLAKLSDEELIARFNAEVGNRGWGNARMYFSHCLHAELMRRPFDTSRICLDSAIVFKQRVALRHNRVLTIDEAEEA